MKQLTVALILAALVAAAPAAAKEGAHFAVILGDELADGQVQLRDLQAGTQQVVPAADLVRHLTRAGDSHRHG